MTTTREEKRLEAVRVLAGMDQSTGRCGWIRTALEAGDYEAAYLYATDPARWARLASEYAESQEPIAE